MFVDDFAEFVGLQTTDEHNRWRRFWRPLLDIWRGFERKDKEIAEMNGNPILLRSQSRNAKSSFETAISIGVENEADLLLRKLGHNLPATENVQQGWEQVGDLERRYAVSARKVETLRFQEILYRSTSFRSRIPTTKTPWRHGALTVPSLKTLIGR